MVTRRTFLKVALLTPLAVKLQGSAPLQAGNLAQKEALYYSRIDQRARTVACRLCPRGCAIGDGETGFCRARKNTKGTLYSLGYGEPCALHIDPIEKKPFFNVLPATYSFSVASAGCNLRCKFCQNWQISQVSPLETMNTRMTPEGIANGAKGKGCKSVAYTYTEPTNFYEYMLETAKAARAHGLLNVQHSNGYINPEPLRELCKYLDAANIDLKGFSAGFYRTVCEAELDPVLETIKFMKKSGVWVEITNLVIPGYNDDMTMIRKMCDWIRENAGPDVPVHFSRFFPMYKMTGIAPTPVSTLERARECALKAGLHYPYIGNVPGHEGENTCCPKCKKIVILRSGYTLLENRLKGGKCPSCGEGISGIWTA
jgi:pyruvate formate lyase activating enzyme